MRITVKVKPNSSREGIEIEDGIYIATLKAPPVEGRANEALIELLSEYFKKARSKIDIVSGHKSRIKIIELKD
ncbi:MAG: DUF167 domain-containing protein [bacterium]